MDKYQNFDALLRGEKADEDFVIVERVRPGAKAIIIAPHGGAIEPRTSEIARAIAGDSFSYYAFEGRKPANNYRDLHITSHRFDEPRAVSLVRAHKWVVAIHGCSDPAPRVFLGGRDRAMLKDIARELAARGVKCEPEGHPFPGMEATNICNRSSSSAGVQIELSMPFRTSNQVEKLALAVRIVLEARNEAA